MNRLNLVSIRAMERYEEAKVVGIFDQWMMLMPEITLKDAVRKQRNAEADK